MTTRAAVLDALAGVRDPELDEPLTELGFVSGVSLDDGEVAVRLRLPTYFCSPSFVYLMAADAHAAVAALPGVGAVRVEVDDHFAGTAIGDATASEEGFGAAFPGESAGEPDALRERFRRKALAARQARIAERMLAAGRTPAQLAAATLADLPPEPDRERCRALRSELGVDAAPAAPAFVRPDGAPLASAEELTRFLRVARLVRVSLEGNGELCRGLLRTRYGEPAPEEAIA
ncbi:iron-sulfur cluster assembly protein [Conexibacter arvalis]|uniref:Metal-sulfur cluster biosynthetic enzyme n=1 Tax=Conexibacter arvalis TaxID=912552 RepID=A0A840IKL8_9ACTN|nr:iron-sulfur cluster assembly protein [Conexibacter arvalis]MBB4664478.1 metal-sulfur cluster biosynthetic enzyme [Conexibacter arvalis]